MPAVAGMKTIKSRILRGVLSVHGLLVMASVVYCLPLLTSVDAWGRGDWDQFSFRYETPRVAMLRDGQLPLWNPYVNGGNVLLAHPHCPAFSPWYLPTLVLGTPLGLRVQVLLFVVLGTTGMATLLRRWNVSAAGCFAGGVMLMMGAHFVMHITEGHLEWCVLGLMPWVTWCLARAKDDWRFAILAALVLTTALLHGSIYIVIVFVPLLLAWSALESVRRRSWRAVTGGAVAMGLTLLLSAVVLLPRLEFLAANPRDTERHEQAAPSQLARMLLDPRQADHYRATRDVRNPPDEELARQLPGQLPLSAVKFNARKWHRLEVALTTDSDWTKLRFEGFDYVLFLGKPDPWDRSSRQLGGMPLSTAGMAIDNQTPGERVTHQATLYARLADRGNMRFVVTRGDYGTTELKVTRNGVPLIDEIHPDVVPDVPGNDRVFTIYRETILRGDPPYREDPDAPWYLIEFTLTTTADWCTAEVADCPYLFRVEDPGQEPPGQRAVMRPLEVSSNPAHEKIRLRSLLYVQRLHEDGVRVKVGQGLEGTTELTFATPEGDPLETTDVGLDEWGGEKRNEYLLPAEALDAHRERLLPLPTPLRWELDRSGMTYDWHEYGFYATWLGLALAVGGLVVTFRRRWPLYVTALGAGLLVLGAALPLNLWAIWKMLPMYGSLQVPSRFLAAVVFAMAVCGGFGLDGLGRWLERVGSLWLRRTLEFALALAIYVELTALAWNLFSDIFVCPPRPLPEHSRQGFAQRYVEDEVRYAAMYSAHYPYLLDNSGVLREYENIAVPRGKVRVVGDGNYRGEVWLETGHGTARITDWTMSRVKVAGEADAADRLVLNQNFFPGWKAVRRSPDGMSEKLTVEPGPEGSGSRGLVSVNVAPGAFQIEIYYLPDSFLLGGLVSGITLLGCLGILLGSGSRHFRSFLPLRTIRRMAVALAAAAGVPWVRYMAGAVALNVPFALCHPGWTLIDMPPVRSLAVGAVLFLVPGLPLVGAMVQRKWLPRSGLLWVMAASFAAFAVVLLVVNMTGIPLSGSVAWNGTWLLTNAAILLNALLSGRPNCLRSRVPLASRQCTGRMPVAPSNRASCTPSRLGGSPTWGVCFRETRWRVAIPIFVAAYAAFYVGATHVVPPMLDHDLDVQGPGYSLLTRFTPEVVNDRKLRHYFAHPLLLNAYEAGSFLYFDQLDYLARFEAATDRARRAESGEPIEPVVREFYRFADGRVSRRPDGPKQDMTRTEVVDVRRGNYLVYPPLPEYDNRLQVTELPVRELEVRILYDDYQRDPRRLPTRTANIFLAALTAALLGGWIDRRTGRWWLALLVTAAYATSPEVFVRSSYGGYFAISMFASMQILLAVERRMTDRSRAAWWQCLLAGAFAGLCNNKLILLPAALIVWQFLRDGQGGLRKRAARSLGHPVVLGFVAATAAFCAYGLLISPADFWADFVEIHVINRMTHHNPFGHTGYPLPFWRIGGRNGLWQESWEHTGFVLLPLGILAVVCLCRMKPAENDDKESDGLTLGWRGLPGWWAVWMLLTALAFTWVDYRQTKHLMPLMLPLHMAPARWAATGRVLLVVVSILFVWLVLWNLTMLRALAVDFGSLPITPERSW